MEKIIASLNQVILTEGRITKYRETILLLESDSYNQEIEYNDITYTIVGKHWKSLKKYLVFNDGNYFEAKIVTATHTIEEDIELELEVTKLGDLQFDPNRFVPIQSGTALDKVFSKSNGIMPSTNYIIIGDPGIGKSTLSIDFCANIQNNNPDKSVLFISGEMTGVDLFEYIERFPNWKSLSTTFVSQWKTGAYKRTLEAYLKLGWDVVVLDSFAEVVSAVQSDEAEKGNKLSYSNAESWLIDLFVQNNDGNNDKSKWTSFVSIQQVTKGGTFVGSNKLKHNTTGMIELRYTRTNEKKIVVTKNRRGYEYDDLHFKFTEKGIEYDIERIEREKELMDKINSEKDQMLADEKKLKELFNMEDDIEIVEAELA